METNFTKGIHTKTKPENTPQGYYRDALNMRISGGSKRTEEGMKKMVGVPANFIQWGDCAIGDETILLGTIGGKSVIGSLNKAEEWNIEVPSRTGVDILKIDSPVQVEGKKNWAGERVIYFSTSAGSRRINIGKLPGQATLPTGDTDFDKVTSLFLEFDLPKTSYTGEGSSGKVPTGVYQFAARLVTDSGAKTSFGIISNVIPVIQSSLSSNRDSVVGNPPQTYTNKSLNIKISNIDPAFKYVELGVLTYVGLSNTPVINYTNLVAINSQKVIQYTYRGESDHVGTLSIDEFIVTGVSYLTGEYMTQKDGTLLIASPTEAVMPPIDWYRVASNIVSEFTVKKIPYKEKLIFEADGMNTTDEYTIREISTEEMDEGYKNPLTATLYKGYRRNEVYAFSLTPVFVSGVYGPTIHIPSNHNVPLPAVNNEPPDIFGLGGDPDAGGVLGTYISEEKYQDTSYPGIGVNDGLRLHKFPSPQDQPIISGNIEDNDCFIRVLGVKFTNIALDPSEMQYAPQIAGFIIGRVNRVGNETQLAQGIVRPHTDVQYNKDPKFGRGTLLGDGFVGWKNYTRDDTAEQTSKNVGSPDLSSFNFIAPDIIHGLYDYQEGSHIKQYDAFVADPYVLPSHGKVQDGKTPRIGFGYPKMFFKNILGASDLTPNSTETELEGSKYKQQPFGVPLASTTMGGKVETSIIKDGEILTMCSSDGFVWLSTKNKQPIQYLREHDFLYESQEYLSEGSAAHQWMINTLVIGTKVTFILHTLIRKDVKQYGPLTQMTSMFTHYQDWKGFSGEVEFFNGDTFINKYGLTLNDEAHYPWTTDDGAGTAGDGTRYIGYMKPPNASGVVYFWLESSNNYAYRHYIQPESFSETNVSQANGSTPFFPAYKQLANAELPLGILSMHAENWRRPGYASQYNNQYSTQPIIKPFVNTPKEDIERKSSLVNRIIYSAAAVQGEKADAYQIFLPNNYYDVPQEFGELTDIYVNNELYASTNQVQWMLYFNTLATQATNVGEVVLGTGGAFNRPATPMVTVDGGYGGTSHWLHAINTVFGRVIVDKLQGKFFLLNKQLQHFSGDLDDEDRLRIEKLDNDVIRVGSEPLRERVIIRTGDITRSFDLENKVFVSRHSYNPRWMFSHGPFMYSNQIDKSIGGTGIYKHSVGPTGVFYDKLHPSSITIAVNNGKTTSKLFKNLELFTKRTTEEGLNLPFNTFNQMEVWSKERYTGLLTITPKSSAFQIPGILEVLASKVKDSFRINMSRDIVIDPSKDIFKVTNHAQKSGDTVLTKWLPRIRGNYVELKLITNNTQGPLFLFDVLVDVDENIR